MTQNNMEVVAWRHMLTVDLNSDTEISVSSEHPFGKPGRDFDQSASVKSEPLVTLTSAQAEIAVQKQANEVLMRERANIIATHREQLDRLTKERDEWRDHVLKQNSNVAHNLARAEAAEKERDALREALKPFADIGVPTDPMSRITVTMDRDFVLAARSALQPLEPKND